MSDRGGSRWHGLSRRRFLRAAGLGLAGGAMAAGGIGWMARERRGPRALHATLPEEAMAALIERTGVHDGPIPEYRKRASLLILPRESGSIKTLSGQTEPLDNTATIQAVIAALPQHSLLLPPYCLWNQDPFHAVVHDGRLRCVMPSEPPPYSPGISLSSLVGYLRFFLGQVEIIRAPFPFAGGNLRFDEVDGQRYAFGDFNGVDEESVRRVFRVDRAFNIGTSIAMNETALHLDELMIFLGEHTVGLIRLTSPGPEGRTADYRHLDRDLDRARTVLKKVLGYRIIDLPTTWTDLDRSYTVTNCLQYEERRGRRHILMPSFDEVDRTESVARVRDAYRASGAVVHTIPSTTAAYSGSLHCLTNMLL